MPNDGEASIILRSRAGRSISGVCLVRRPVDQDACDWGRERGTEKERGGGTAYPTKGMGDPETKEIIEGYKNEQRVEEGLNRDLSRSRQTWVAGFMWYVDVVDWGCAI